MAEDHTGIMPEIQFHLVPIKPLQELKKIHWEMIGMVSAVTVQGFFFYYKNSVSRWIYWIIGDPAGDRNTMK